MFTNYVEIARLALWLRSKLELFAQLRGKGMRRRRIDTEKEGVVA